MCRIFGLLDPHLGHDALHRLGEQTAGLLRHGGPDGHAHRVFDGGLIGGTRLAISDPAHGWQPFTRDGLTVFYNGEIYNAPALRRQLAAEGVQFSTDCDGEVIAPLFARHGTGAAALLDGMFAIAVHEQRTGRLTLIRDQAGIKPLYLFADGGRFGFASELAALLRLRGTAVQVDPDALDRYLRFKAPFGAVPAPGALGDPTMVEGVHALPPGHALQVTPGGAPRVTRVAEVAATRHTDPVADLGRLLPEAVAGMLPTDVPYCSVLSGGLDSSVVTTLAARAAGPVQTFTVVPRKKSAYDELAYAQLVAETTGSPLEQVPVGGGDIPALLPAVVASLGQPNSDPIIVSTYRLFRAVREAGYPVALTGDASDELFGGYDRFRALARSGDATGYRDALAGVPAAWQRSLYTDGALARLETAARPDDGPWARSHACPPTAADAATDFELRHRLPVYHLQRVDHLSAAHAVEARVPFCRNGVTALGRSLTLAQKLGPDDTVKITLARAAARHGWAPDAVLNRPKQPFTFRLADHLLDEQGLALDWARQVLTDPAARRGWFAPDRVEKLLAEFEERRTEPLAHTVWALLVLELWLGQIDGGVR
ncbi:asparagine synthase (glutamine-hydrolyzing) [Streptomyces sp. SID8379]|uniref:asparagine synthase (glutamine-hydrolyzing) n=1 Tax=unclassified Streptomyces TaxID=2593676 RepID=UPI000372D633|nr:MULTISPECIES: asparagine synthase (glutamine-hydrolyzing) [unclassified Streptomyces]MYW67542.1 asparagine synthase (glutamine-hydrolyzing) [Streptomyces sp. SID8379]